MIKTKSDLDALLSRVLCRWISIYLAWAVLVGGGLLGAGLLFRCGFQALAVAILGLWGSLCVIGLRNYLFTEVTRKAAADFLDTQLSSKSRLLALLYSQKFLSEIDERRQHILHEALQFFSEREHLLKLPKVHLPWQLLIGLLLLASGVTIHYVKAIEDFAANEKAQALLEKVLKEHKIEQLPKVQEALEAVQEKLSENDISSETIKDALAKAEKEIEQAEAALKDGKANLALVIPTPTPTATKKAEDLMVPTQDSSAEEKNNKENKKNNGGNSKDDSKDSQNGKDGEKDKQGKGEGKNQNEEGKNGSGSKEGSKDSKDNGGDSSKGQGDKKGNSKGEKQDNGKEGAKQALDDAKSAIKALQQQSDQKKQGQDKQGQDKEGQNKEGQKPNGSKGDNKEESKDSKGDQGKEGEREGEKKQSQGSDKKNGEEGQNKDKDGEGKKDEMKGAPPKQEKEGSKKGSKGGGADGASLGGDRGPEQQQGPMDGKGNSGSQQKSLKETELGKKDEALDYRFVEKNGELVKNSKDAKPKTDISNVTLSTPEPIEERGKQPIPLEYKDLLQ